MTATRFTKEQLIKRLEEQESSARYALGFVQDSEILRDIEMDLRIIEIALASLTAEPVAWIVHSRGGDQLTTDANYVANAEGMGGIHSTPVYAAPPAPVVPDALPENDDEEGNDIDYMEPSEIYVLGRTAGWNACRAAMLQGKAEPVSNRDELPLDYLQGHKDGLEWAAQLAEANHPQTGDWLYDDPIELAKAIRKGPDMPESRTVIAEQDDNFYSWFGRFWIENYQQKNYTTSAKQTLGTLAEFAYRAGRDFAIQAGNSPVIPDRWIPVSERMPDKDGNYWGWWSKSKSQGPVWFTKTDSYSYFQSSEITHWMPLPAAPQQEVK